MRFYISQTIGNGTEDNPFRPAVSDYLQDWRCVDMRSDAKVSGLLFVECSPSQVEHNLIIADSLNAYVDTGDLGLDDSLIDNPNLSSLLAQLETYQVPTDDFTVDNTLRELLQRVTKRFLIRQLLTGSDMPNDLEAFLTVAERAAAQARANELGVSIELNKKSRDIIKDVAAINHKFLKTHYDN